MRTIIQELQQQMGLSTVILSKMASYFTLVIRKNPDNCKDL